MMPRLASICHMGGYAYYVWSAYGVVFFTLFLQWLLPCLHWRQLKQTHSPHVTDQQQTSTHDIASNT